MFDELFYILCILVLVFVWWKLGKYLYFDI